MRDRTRWYSGLAIAATVREAHVALTVVGVSRIMTGPLSDTAPVLVPETRSPALA